VAFQQLKLAMAARRYDIFLDSKLIGTTALEKADAPMGCVFGRIDFTDASSAYDYLKKYCIANNIDLVFDSPEDKLLSTQTLERLKVVNMQGIEIKGLGNQISGMDSEEFEITIEGIAYPFFEKEFPHHVKAYEEHIKECK
jgi:hypothetical protein